MKSSIGGDKGMGRRDGETNFYISSQAIIPRNLIPAGYHIRP